jgi:hypothetical protein
LLGLLSVAGTVAGAGPDPQPQLPQPESQQPQSLQQHGSQQKRRWNRRFSQLSLQQHESQQLLQQVLQVEQQLLQLLQQLLQQGVGQHSVTVYGTRWQRFTQTSSGTHTLTRLHTVH